MFAERKRGKNKGSKLVAFLLAFALVLAGIGTFAGLDGIFTMRARAAELSHAVTAGTVYTIGTHRYVAAESGSDEVLFIAETPIGSMEFREIYNVQENDFSAINNDLLIAGLDLKVVSSLWTYYNPMSGNETHSSPFGVPTKSQVEGAVSGLSGVTAWTSTKTDSDDGYFLNSGVVDTKAIDETEMVLAAFKLDLSEEINIDSSGRIEFAIPIDAEHFPDDNFRYYIAGETAAGMDQILTQRERSSVGETNSLDYLFLSSQSISDLTGIEYLKALTTLLCMNNQLTELDLSKNRALTRLECYGNQITELDFSNNPVLKALSCQDNQLTSLNVSNNPALTRLSCENNQLTALDLSHNTALTELTCSQNNLTTLDLSNNTVLNLFGCSDNQLTGLKFHLDGCGKVEISNGGQGFFELPSGIFTNTARVESQYLINANKIRNLTAIPPANAVFDHWETTGDVTKDGDTFTFGTGDATITAVWTSPSPTPHTLTVNEVYQDENGTEERTETSTATYDDGEEATVTKSAPSGYSIVGDSTQTVTMDGDKAITFIYKKNAPGTHTLTINEVYLFANGTTERTETSTETYTDGEEVTITKTAPAGYTLYGEASQSFTMTEDKTIVFTYIKDPETYTLTVNEVYQDESGDEERTVTSTETYTDGEEATVTKTAPVGYSIVGAATQTATMDQNRTLTFIYKKNSSGTSGGSTIGTIPITAETYTLTVNEVYQDEDGNEERANTTTITTSGGEIITRTATAPEGYSIVGESSQTVTMNDDKTITFTYRKDAVIPPDPIDPNPPTPPAPIDPNPPRPAERYTVTFEDGLGNVLLQETVDKGAATPLLSDIPEREGYTFAGWSPTVSSTVTGNTTYVATWRENEKPKHTITIISILVDEDGNITGSSSKTIQYNEGETVTIAAENPEGYTVNGDSTVTFVVDGDRAIEFTYQKNSEPDPIDPNPPAPVEPDPVNPDPVNPDPIDPNPPIPIVPDPDPNPGGDNGGSGGSTIVPIPIVPDNGGNGGGGGDTKQPDNTYEEPDNKKPDDTDKPSDDTKKPDDKEKTDNDKPTPVIPTDNNKPDEGNKPQPTNPDNGDKPSDGDTPDKADTSDDQNDTSNWLTDNTPEGKALRRNVAIGVTTGGIIVTLVATGALKYLWLLLLLLFFKFKSVKFHGILTNEKNKYIKVKATDKNEDALSLQGYAKLLDTASDIREAAVSSGYVTELPMGTTMMIEYADRIEKIKADENKMYELLSEARGKVGVNLINKAAKFDIRLDFNL